MGNTKSSKSHKELLKEDETWLNQDGLAIAFDQAFIASVINNLQYTSEIKLLGDSSTKSKHNTDNHNPIERKYQHMAEIFGSNTSSENASLLSCDIPELNVSSISADNTLGYMTERAIVLQRYYQAHKRQVDVALEERKTAETIAIKEAESTRQNESKDSNTSTDISTDSSTDSNDNEETMFPLSQPEGFFVSSSIEMSLVLARSMAMSGNPAVVNAVCQTLLNLMEKSKGAIFDGIENNRSWTSESLKSIQQFAKEISTGVLEGILLGPNERSMGSALELALALQHGKLPRLLRVAQQLFSQHGESILNKKDGTSSTATSQLQFPPTVVKFIQSIARNEPIYGIESLEKKHYITSSSLLSLITNVNVHFSNPDVPDVPEVVEGEPKSISSIVVGTTVSKGYMYVLSVQTSVDRTQRVMSLQKIGTGTMGTNLGQLYITKTMPILNNDNGINDDEKKAGTLTHGRWFINCLASFDCVVVMRSSTPNKMTCFDIDTLEEQQSLLLVGGSKLLGLPDNNSSSSNTLDEQKTESTERIEQKDQEKADNEEDTNPEKISINYDNYAMCTNGRRKIFLISTPLKVTQNHIFTIHTYDVVQSSQETKQTTNDTTNETKQTTNKSTFNLTTELSSTVHLVSQYPINKKDKKKTNIPIVPASHNAWYCNGMTLACLTPNPKAKIYNWSLSTGYKQETESKGCQLWWDPTKVAQGVTLRNDNMQAAVTGSRGNSYSCQRSEQIFREGRHKIVLRCDKNTGDDSSLFIGIADISRPSIERSNGSQAKMYTYQADGYTYANENSSSGGPRLRVGGLVTMILDCDKNTIDFYHSSSIDSLPGRKIRNMRLPSNGSYWVVSCFGGDQTISIVDHQELGDGGGMGSATTSSGGRSGAASVASSPVTSGAIHAKTIMNVLPFPAKESNENSSNNRIAAAAVADLIATQAAASVKCTNGHVLQAYVTTGGSCDKCGVSVSGGGNVFDCRSCNYWLCTNCYQQAESLARQSLTDAQSVVSAAAAAVEAAAMEAAAAAAAAVVAAISDSNVSESKATNSTNDTNEINETKDNNTSQTPVSKYCSISHTLSIAVDINGTNDTYAFDSSTNTMHRWKNNAPTKVWWNDESLAVQNQQCNPLQVYKNCTEKNNQRLTTGTAALALMASLDIVTASTMTLSKTSAIEGVALRRNEKKNKKKNKNKTKNKKSNDKDPSFGISPDTETLNLLLKMMQELRSSLKESPNDEILIKGLIMTLRLTSVQLHHLPQTSMYNLNGLRILLRDIVGSVPEKLEIMSTTNSKPSLNNVNAPPTQPKERKVNNSDSNLLHSTLKETATQCFNAAVAMLYKDSLSRANLLMAVMGEGEQKMKGNKQKENKQEEETKETKVNEKSTNEKSTNETSTNEKSTNDDTLAEAQKDLIFSKSPGPVAKAVVESLSDVCSLHDLVSNHPATSLRLLSFLIKRAKQEYFRTITPKEELSTTAMNNNATEKEVITSLLLPLITHLLNYCVSYSTKNATNEMNQSISFLLSKLIDIFNIIGDSLVACLNAIIVLNNNASETDLEATEATSAIEMLASSVMGRSILPVLVALTVLTSESTPDQNTFSITTEMREKISTINSTLDHCIACISNRSNRSNLLAAEAGITHVDESISKELESSHPYENNTNSMTEIDFPELRNKLETNKSHEIALLLSPQSRTERQCDYYQFYTDVARSNSLTGPLSGTGTQLGHGTTITMPIGCSKLFLHFKTDGSTNYWGYKMELKTTIFKEVKIDKSNWTLDLKKCLGIFDIMTVVPMLKTVRSMVPKNNSIKQKQNGSQQATEKGTESNGKEDGMNESKIENENQISKKKDQLFQILQDPLLQYGLLPTNESSTTTSKKQLLRTNTEMKWTDPNQAFLMNVLDGEEGKCVKRESKQNKK